MGIGKREARGSGSQEALSVLWVRSWTAELAETGVPAGKDELHPRRRLQAPALGPARTMEFRPQEPPAAGRRPSTLRPLRPLPRARRVVAAQCPPPSSPPRPSRPLPRPPQRPGRADLPPCPSKPAAAAAARRRRLPRAAPAFPAAQFSRLGHFPSSLFPPEPQPLVLPPRGDFSGKFLFSASAVGEGRSRFRSSKTFQPPAPAIGCPPRARPSDERPSGSAATQPVATRGRGGSSRRRRAGPGVGARARAVPGSRRSPGRGHLVPSADRPEPRASAAATGLVRGLQPGARPRDGLLHRRPEGKARCSEPSPFPLRRGRCPSSRSQGSAASQPRRRSWTVLAPAKVGRPHPRHSTPPVLPCPILYFRFLSGLHPLIHFHSSRDISRYIAVFWSRLSLSLILTGAPLSSPWTSTFLALNPPSCTRVPLGHA